MGSRVSVSSEIGRLRKVIVHPPGRELERHGPLQRERIAAADAQLRRHIETDLGRHSLLQSAIRGALDGGAVGERVAERHAQLDHVSARRGEHVEQSGRPPRFRVAGSQVRDECPPATRAELGQANGERIDVRRNSRIHGCRTGRDRWS